MQLHQLPRRRAETTAALKIRRTMSFDRHVSVCGLHQGHQSASCDERDEGDEGDEGHKLKHASQLKLFSLF